MQCVEWESVLAITNRCAPGLPPPEFYETDALGERAWRGNGHNAACELMPDGVTDWMCWTDDGSDEIHREGSKEAPVPGKVAGWLKTIAGQYA